MGTGGDAAVDTAVARAIELNPNFAEAYLWQSLIQSTAGSGQDSPEATPWIEATVRPPKSMAGSVS